MKLKLNRWPARQAVSAACSRATWFLRGSWVPTHSSSGRLPTRKRARARAQSASVGTTRSVGSGTARMSGPATPIALSIVRQPRYSVAAAAEIVATRSKWRTAAR